MTPTALPERVTCLVAGGGPAGVMLGYLLSRAGIDTWVLEKHPDFFRDFRGDTIHPSTLEVMAELGLVDRLLALPHSELRTIGGQIGDDRLTLADFSRISARCPFVAVMPQWDFLDFLVREGRRFPLFHVAMRAEVVDLVTDGATVVGARVQMDGTVHDIHATLVVGADGRHSVVRARAGLTVDQFGAPMDVLWFRMAKTPADQPQPLGRVNAGRFLVMIDRNEYWQCAFLIPKGTVDELRARGLPALRDDIARAAPFLRERLAAIDTWDDVKLLTVMVDRLRTWSKPGLLCIGDAAHAMSPVGGVGINLAIQDAVAAANLLALPLGRGVVTERDLAQVQRRREWPTRVTQRVQITIQNAVIARVLGGAQVHHAPWPLRLVGRSPALQRRLAGFVGLGVRPEHVRVAERALPAS